MTLNGNEVERTRITEKIARQIATQLVESKLKPGDKLPSESDLMKKFGVGRSSLREALGLLGFMGLLDIRPGSGARVTDYPESFLSKPLSWGLLFAGHQIRELQEARIIIEEAAVELAAARANEKDIEEMERYLDQMEAQQNDLQKATKDDLLFHIAIAKSSHNHILKNMLYQIRTPMSKWIEQALGISGVFSSALTEHRAIIQSIKNRDAKAAKSAMSHHIEEIGKLLNSTASSKESVEKGHN